MQTETIKRLFTVDEYYRMADAGILREGDRTELINGEVIQMSSMGLRHCAALNRATDFFAPVLKGRAIVQVQIPTRLDRYNEPEPALSVLKYRSGFLGPGE